MITIYFGGESLYPSNTLPNKIWTSEHLFGVAGCPIVFSLKKQNKTNKQNTRSETEKPALCCVLSSGARLFLRKITDYSSFSYRSVIQCMKKKFKCSQLSLAGKAAIQLLSNQYFALFYIGRAVINMTPFIPTSPHVNPLERLQANPGIYQYQLYFHKEVCIRFFGFFMKCSCNDGVNRTKREQSGR